MPRWKRSLSAKAKVLSSAARVEATDLAATLLDLAADAEDVACPGLLRSILLSETELCALAQVKGIGAYPVGAVEADLSDHSLVYRTGEDEGTVVVGVLPDEVDTYRGGEEDARLAIELGELAADLCRVHVLCLCIDMCV